MSHEPTDRRNRDASYYQDLHESNPAFQHNNWLIEELPVLAALGGRSLLEVGCGNGRFLREAARSWSEVVGLDWARSPLIAEVLRDCPNVRFIQADVRAFRWPQRFDVLASADVLEHLPPSALAETLPNLHRMARLNFHKIACYDDGHSHLSIHPPEWWLARFQDLAPDAGYRLHRVTARKGDPTKQVITLTNGSHAAP
ncbi:MAG: hypothetical protein RL322_954 [Pseudomonadota bacterium]|jgi:cyclopropane fatty-acyl-phospholipid synthase-like methyltransferase